MRILFHHDPVVKRARFALVRIEAEVDRPWMILGQERPFQTGRETRPRRGPADCCYLTSINDVRCDPSVERLFAAH